jgi:hypothetical protein
VEELGFTPAISKLEYLCLLLGGCGALNSLCDGFSINNWFKFIDFFDGEILLIGLELGNFRGEIFRTGLESKLFSGDVVETIFWKVIMSSAFNVFLLLV